MVSCKVDLVRGREDGLVPIDNRINMSLTIFNPTILLLNLHPEPRPSAMNAKAIPGFATSVTESIVILNAHLNRKR